MSVYLISYDIAEQNKSDDAQVIALLTEMKAVRCLYSEWLYEGTGGALDIANRVGAELADGDRLLVVRLDSDSAYTALRNQPASVALLRRA